MLYTRAGHQLTFFKGHIRNLGIFHGPSKFLQKSLSVKSKYQWTKIIIYNTKTYNIIGFIFFFLICSPPFGTILLYYTVCASDESWSTVKFYIPIGQHQLFFNSKPSLPLSFSRSLEFTIILLSLDNSNSWTTQIVWQVPSTSY